MGYTVEITELTNNVAISTTSPTIEVYYDTVSVAGPTGPAGADGTDGSDGVSVSSASINGSGNLLLTKSINDEIRCRPSRH